MDLMDSSINDRRQRRPQQQPQQHKAPLMAHKTPLHVSGQTLDGLFFFLSFWVTLDFESVTLDGQLGSTFRRPRLAASRQ